MTANVGSNGVQQQVQLNQQQVTQEAQVQSSYHPTIDPFRTNVMPKFDVGVYGDLFGANQNKKADEKNKSSLAYIDDIYPFESDDEPNLVENICNKLMSFFKLDDVQDNNPFKEMDTMLDIVGSVNGKIAQKGKGILNEYLNTNKALEEGFLAYTA